MKYKTFIVVTNKLTGIACDLMGDMFTYTKKLEYRENDNMVVYLF